MLIVLILVSIALVVSLYLNLRPSSPLHTAPPKAERDAPAKERSTSDAELERKQRELEESKAALAEAKEQLKQAKKKLYEQKESDKAGNDLTKARETVERRASVELEHTRAELSAAQAELTKLRAEADPKARRTLASPPPSAPPAPAPQKVIRELSEADKEKMTRLEQQAAKDRRSAQELERETRRLKSRLDTDRRVYVVTKGELDLMKDKFKALEKRLNRTLLEKDLYARALKDLEKQSGVTATMLELSAEDAAASDRRVDERQAEENRASEQRVAEAERQAERALADSSATEAAAEAAALPPAAAVATPPTQN